MTRRSLGQHYLVDHSVVERLVVLARIAKGERVLEIGTGRGAVTKELCRVATDVEGYEIDEENFKATKKAVGSERLRLHLADAFRARPRFDVLVSSLPYSRSSSFIEWISGVPYGRAVVLLQEDFVRKIASPPGQRDYRAISVIAQSSSDLEVLERIPRSAFSPRPKVDTVIVSLKPKRRLSDAQIRGIKRLFGLRRRTVSAALGKSGANLSDALRSRRIYSLSPDEVLALLPAFH
jgi:16S rRNA (adenine1518-N6/adenine1519-N6)-dimethyltransferase